MKKKVALLLAGVLTVSVFSGCGNQNNESNVSNEADKKTEQSASTSSAAESSEQADEEVTEIVVWDNSTGMKDYLLEQVEEFNSTIGKEENIKLVWEFQTDDTAKEMAMIDGNGPDITAIGSIAKSVESGWFVSLDDIPEIAETVAKNSQYRREKSNCIDGKMYTMVVCSQILGLAYNKDMFKEAGIVDENGEAKPPATYEEMIECARILTDESKQQYGIIFPGKWIGFYSYEISMNSMQNKGRGSYNPNTGLYDYAHLVPTLEMMMTMREEGLVYPGMEGMDNDPARARFAEGNIGMKYAVEWDVSVWNEQFPVEFDWGVAPLPVVSEEERYVQMKQPGVSMGITTSGVEKKGADKIAVVFNWYYSDEMLIKMYEDGKRLPWRSDIAEAADFTGKDVAKGWIDFGNLVEISGQDVATLPVDITGYEKDAASVMSDVFSGKMSPKEWAEERAKIYNEGIENYKKLHPEEDYSDRILPDWEPAYQ